jgi:hypothetical protein
MLRPVTTQFQIRAWQRAEEIRAFFRALSALVEERRAAGHGGNSVDQYLAWTLAQADRIDPRTTILDGGTLPADAQA